MLGATLEVHEATFFYRCFLLFCTSCWTPEGTVLVATLCPHLPFLPRKGPMTVPRQQCSQSPQGLAILAAHWPVCLLEDEIQ